MHKVVIPAGCGARTVVLAVLIRRIRVLGFWSECGGGWLSVLLSWVHDAWHVMDLLQLHSYSILCMFLE